jgi:hypothetical protein
MKIRKKEKYNDITFMKTEYPDDKDDIYKETFCTIEVGTVDAQYHISLDKTEQIQLMKELAYHLNYTVAPIQDEVYPQVKI